MADAQSLGSIKGFREGSTKPLSQNSVAENDPSIPLGEHSQT